MLYLVVFFLLSALLVLLLLQLKVRATIEYQHDHINDHIVLIFSTMKGLIGLKYEIPLVDVEKRGLKLNKYKKVALEREKEGKKEKTFDSGKLFERISYFKDFYEIHKQFICDTRDYLKGRLILEALELEAELGTGDAFYTGIFNGVAWSMAGALTSFLTNSFTTLKKKVNIKSNFMEKKFKVDLFCIFTIKIVHIIWVRIKFFLYKARLKSKKNER